MQGMVMGLNHVTTGLGALFGSAFYSAVAIITDVAGNIITIIIISIIISGTKNIGATIVHWLNMIETNIKGKKHLLNVEGQSKQIAFDLFLKNGKILTT